MILNKTTVHEIVHKFINDLKIIIYGILRTIFIYPLNILNESEKLKWQDLFNEIEVFDSDYL